LRMPAEQLAVTSPVVFCDDIQDSKALRCSRQVLGRLRMLFGRLVGCRISDANAEFTEEEFDEPRCRRRVQRQYDEAVRRLTGCAPCLNEEVRVSLKTRPVTDLLNALEPDASRPRAPLGVAHCSCQHGFDTCDDGNACTMDVCDPVGGCSHLPSNSQGTCELSEPDPCAKGTCESGRCVKAADNEGTACPDDDGNPCTSGICRNMACTPTPTNEAEQCPDDGNECTDDQCAAGTCAHPPREDGTACDDGDACNGSEVCASGRCRPGAEPLCLDNDLNPCTTATCDSLRGCVFVTHDGPCEDGSACTFDDACFDGACEGKFLDCDDGNPCTVDTCSDVSGCVHTPVRGCP